MLSPLRLFPTWLAALPLLVSSGCGESSASAPPSRSLASGPDLLQYADLPGLRATHDPRLRAELARLTSEQATPRLLAQGMEERGGRARRRFAGTQELERILPPELRSAIEQELAAVYPAGRFQFGVHQLRQANRLRTEYGEQIGLLTRLFAQPGLYFTWDPRRGICTELRSVDDVAAGLKLASLAIADRVEHGQLEEAVDALEPLFAATSAIADMPYSVPRVSAVHMRQHILEVLREICLHPNADAAVYEQALDLILRQQAAVPLDREAWMGDRAAGLHLYELIRDGYLLSVLTYDELRQLRDLGNVERLSKMVMDNLDNDELFYLVTMRTAIAACDQPFYKRRAMFSNLEVELASLRDGPSYPFIADQILLAQLRQGQRLQALDRARLMAWSLALRTALGREVTPTINPLTGFPHVHDAGTERVVVGVDPEQAEAGVTLPLLWSIKPAGAG